jgi:hypothetical protein
MEVQNFKWTVLAILFFCMNTIVLAVPPHAPEFVQGKIWDADQGIESQPLFVLRKESFVTESGLKRVQIRYEDAATGDLAAGELLESRENGTIFYRLDHRQIGTVSEVVLSQKQFEVRFQDSNTNQKRAEHSGDGPFVLGPMLVDWIRGHWDDLNASKKVHVEFVVPYRLESYGFRFEKQGENSITFKPRSALLRLFIHPLVFVFDTEKKLKSVEGRTFLKKKVDGRWEDFTAKTVF